ncbi:hypothetical protein MACH01_10680 [Thalassospira tepidiphila]|nr:hypothetical protein MACH01_10680 [Thalassospira tepidiphila]
MGLGNINYPPDQAFAANLAKRLVPAHTSRFAPGQNKAKGWDMLGLGRVHDKIKPLNWANNQMPSS